MLAECLLRPPSRLVLPSKRKGGPLPPHPNPNPPPPAAASTTHGLRSYGERHLGVVLLLGITVLGMGIFPSSRFPFPRPLLPRSLGFSLSLSLVERESLRAYDRSLPFSLFSQENPLLGFVVGQFIAGRWRGSVKTIPHTTPLCALHVFVRVRERELECVWSLVLLLWRHHLAFYGPSVVVVFLC